MSELYLRLLALTRDAGDDEALDALSLVFYEIASKKQKRLDAAMEIFDRRDELQSKEIERDVMEFCTRATRQHGAAALCLELIRQVAAAAVTTGDDRLVRRLGEYYQEKVASFRATFGKSQH